MSDTKPTLAEDAAAARAWQKRLAFTLSRVPPEVVHLVLHRSEVEQIAALLTRLADVACEVDELKRIRDLLVKAVMLATGASKELVEAGPMMTAKRHRERHAEAVALLRNLSPHRHAQVFPGENCLPTCVACAWHERRDALLAKENTHDTEPS